MRRGFSLIELLVAVGIAALLMALLLPALANVREASKRAMCLVNLRSFGQAIRLYHDTYASQLPEGELRLDLPAGRRTLLDNLTPFLDVAPPSLDTSGAVVTGAPFLCPSDPTRAQPGGMSYDYYAGDLMIAFRRAGDEQAQRTVSMQYANRSGLPLMGDPVYRTPTTPEDTDAGGWHHGLGGSPSERGRNAVYSDGRADWLRLSERP